MFVFVKTSTSTCLTTASLLVIIVGLIRIGTRVSQRRSIRAKIQRKRKAVDLAKSKLEQELLIGTELVPAFREEIVRLPTLVLLRKLREGDLSCVQVLKAFQSKALAITKETNCVTEFIREAEEWALKLDQSQRRGPLFGLPVSIKENIAIKGYDCTTGISSLIDVPMTRDAALVAALKALGAIPFCKTNVPQGLMSPGCSNPVWGSTTHPLSKDRTPGGSSGGEGCLISAGGSPVGIGTDIGGSVRIPAALCGIVSLKPSFQRLSGDGLMKSTTPCVGMAGVPGILARDVDTLVLVSKCLLENCLQLQYDRTVLPIPWNEQLFSATKRLRIGFYEDDGYFPTTPGVRRAVQVARAKLEHYGHELVPFMPPNVEYVVTSVMAIFQGDQGKHILRVLDGEDIDPCISQYHSAISTPDFVKLARYLWMRWFSPRNRPFSGVGAMKVKCTYRLWDELQKKVAYRAEFISRWKDAGLDLCIGPPFACPAPLSKDIGYLYACCSYTKLYNFVDFPAGIVPITLENQEDQSRLQGYYEGDAACRLAKQTTRGALNMPLCVQVIALPYQEELVLRGMKVLETTHPSC